jgi:hypothetical protein
MKLVQVIGLPASGKTFAINQLGIGGLTPYIHLDIANYNSERNFNCSLDRLKESKYSVIAESAAGVLRPTNHIVKLQLSSYELWMERLGKRPEINYDKKYFAYLKTRAIPVNYTVESSNDLTELLFQLLSNT